MIWIETKSSKYYYEIFIEEENKTRPINLTVTLCFYLPLNERKRNEELGKKKIIFLISIRHVSYFQIPNTNLSPISKFLIYTNHLQDKNLFLFIHHPFQVHKWEKNSKNANSDYLHYLFGYLKKTHWTGIVKQWTTQDLIVLGQWSEVLFMYTSSVLFPPKSSMYLPKLLSAAQNTRNTDSTSSQLLQFLLNVIKN